jgi:KamA family protein
MRDAGMDHRFRYIMTHPRLRFFTLPQLPQIPQLQALSSEFRRHMAWVAHVLPFRVNNYVIDELIDWNAVPADPLFQLTFPQPDMLLPEHYRRLSNVLEDPLGSATGPLSDRAKEVIAEIRWELNPHPQGQLEHNVPKLDGQPLPGMQHKYRETALVFPAAGQTCHAYCTFCFRWAQFVGMPDLKLATDESKQFCEYLRRHQNITDVLFTGGDPLVMRADVLARYVEPLLGPEFAHIRTIRFGTKSLSYWPYRYTADKDSDSLMRLLERVVESGRHLAFMTHFNHWRELETPVVAQAIARLRSVGAVVRTQSPLVRHINDDAQVWARMWQRQVHLGCIPYYMFVERDTGAQHYFKVPLAQAIDIYRIAMQQVSGLARTARGPVMSSLPGKIVLDGVTEIGGERVFALSFLQGREANWCKRPFFAKYDRNACWLHDLRPAFGESEFFYENELRQLLTPAAAPSPTTVPESVPASVELLHESITTAA